MRISQDLNAIQVGDITLLLTLTPGSAVHLTREAGLNAEGRGAVPDYYLSAGRKRPSPHRRDRSCLIEPRWAEMTLCGRPWILMAGGRQDERSEDGAQAPTCRRCLALIDRLFPEPKLDDRFLLIVELVTDTVAEHGYAEIRDVPGDHHAALRKRVRSALRQRTGHGCRTYVHESMIIFVCEAIHDRHAAQREAQAREALGSFLNGEPPGPLARPWHLSWGTWAAG